MNQRPFAAVASWRHRPTPPPVDGSAWRVTALRYVAACAGVGVAGAAHGWLEHVFGSMPPFVTFYPAVLLVVLFAGGGPGIVSVVLSSLVIDVDFIAPIGSFSWGTPPQRIGLAVFVCTGAVLCTLSERLRRARWAETERKRVEDALRETDRRKNVFLATLSHELRNPLAPIRTAARLLESPLVSPDDLARCRSIISRQVAQMASLLDDLLDVSRLTRDELSLKKAQVPLQQVLDAAVEAVQPTLEARNHRLVLELPAPMMLDVDPVRLTQVISNLLTNAAKYTNPGGTITLGCHVDAEALEIFVRDNGVGLEPHVVARIFDMFVQLEPATENSAGGLGIGLALVKALVELHGGSIAVHSAGRGQGSTFTLKLPRTALVQTSAAGHPPPRAAPQVARRVLIADDNADGAEILALLLQTSGHTVHVANDGASAMEMAARLKPDVAVLDIGMPGLNGYEVAKRIRGESWGSGMMLIALTGWGQDEDKNAALAAGFDHHLTKPTDPARLESLLATLH